MLHSHFSEEETLQNFDRGTQIEQIEKTFEDALKMPVHPDKKELRPIEILPVFQTKNNGPTSRPSFYIFFFFELRAISDVSFQLSMCCI